MEKMARLREALAEVADLRSAAAVLVWDQRTYMPPGGSEARGRQLSRLSKLAHERFASGEVGELLEGLKSYEESLPYDSDDASLLRLVRRNYEREARLDANFVAELTRHTSDAYAVWARARPADDFEAARPYLERGMELSRRYAEYFPESEHPADPLIEGPDPGMSAASVREVFSQLRERLLPLAGEILSGAPANDSCLRRGYGEAEKFGFAEDVIRRFGYDFERGRQDLTPHPFMIRFANGDVRITTRTAENDLRSPLFPTMHEAGHALYEQNVAPDFDGTPLARGTSMGLHESQSRLWENIVGRGRPFWRFFYPRLQKTFPAQLKDVPMEEFHRAINKVERSLIRTEADEVTYNLHVIMRFDFELDLLEGNMEVRDLPEAWRERMKEDLGVVPTDDRDGCLQDAHWFNGIPGGKFQGYTLGNVMSAQIYDSALDARPEIPNQTASGEFGALRGWLTENIYRHGSKFTADEILQSATGSPLSIEPYMKYLRSKYGELYGI